MRHPRSAWYRQCAVLSGDHRIVCGSDRCTKRPPPCRAQAPLLPQRRGRFDKAHTEISRVVTAAGRKKRKEMVIRMPTCVSPTAAPQLCSLTHNIPTERHGQVFPLASVQSQGMASRIFAVTKVENRCGWFQPWPSHPGPASSLSESRERHDGAFPSPCALDKTRSYR